MYKIALGATAILVSFVCENAMGLLLEVSEINVWLHCTLDILSAVVITFNLLTVCPCYISLPVAPTRWVHPTVLVYCAI